MDIKVLSRQRFGRQSPAGELFNHLFVWFCICWAILFFFLVFCILGSKRYNCSHFQLLTIKVFINIHFISGQLWFLWINVYYYIKSAYYVNKCSIQISSFFWHFTDLLAQYMCFILVNSHKLLLCDCLLLVLLFCTRVLWWFSRQRQCSLHSFAAIFILSPAFLTELKIWSQAS